MDIDFKDFVQVREDGVLMVRENTEKGYAEVMPGGYSMVVIRRARPEEVER